MRIHHVTAIAGEPQRNLDFYAGLLGLRLVKLTVNYDDPGTYHFYYGDELGRPGTLLTFFPWSGSRPGRQGTGQINGVALAIPQGSLGHWVERLLSLSVKFEGPTRRFGEQVLAFADPDGMMLELIATPRVAGVEGWRDGPVPAEHAIRGVYGVTIWEDGDAGSAAFLTDTIGYTIRGEADQEYILGVAAYVDRKMREITDKLPVASLSKVAILASLNIADELFKERAQREGRDHLLESRAAQLSAALDDILQDSPSR